MKLKKFPTFACPFFLFQGQSQEILTAAQMSVGTLLGSS